jgi:hypothetical protein
MTFEQETLQLTESCATLLPSSDVENIRGLAKAGEWGVALENLATQLFEYDVGVPAEFAKRYVTIATSIGLDPKYAELVRALRKL